MTADTSASVARRIARRAPLGLMRVLTDGKLIVPYYHVVSDERVPYVEGLYPYRTVGQFREDLEFFLREYQPISIDDLRRHVWEKVALPRRAFLLTFDDGFACLHGVVAPMLEAKGVPAVFFLITSCLDNREMAVSNQAAVLASSLARASMSVRRMVEGLLDEAQVRRAPLESRLLQLGQEHGSVVGRIAAILDVDIREYLSKHRPYLSSDQARSLARRGFAIGAHSIDHPRYRTIPLEEQLRQTRESLRTIRAEVDPASASFAFPHSDAGVALDFYRALSQEHPVTLCFGTSDMRRDPVAFSFQRFSMEMGGLPARALLAEQYARKLARMISGRDVVRRTESG